MTKVLGLYCWRCRSTFQSAVTEDEVECPHCGLRQRIAVEKLTPEFWETRKLP